MASANRKRLRSSEVPLVLYSLVSKKALRLGINSKFLSRPSGKPLVLYERRRQAAKKSVGSSTMVRIAARAAMRSGVAIYKNASGTRYEIMRVPIKYVGCAMLPSWLRGMTKIDAAGGVVVTNGGKPRVLLLSKTVGKNSYWVLPKGKRNPSEARRRTARREVIEESGLSRVDVGPFLNRERYFDVEGGRVVYKEVSYFLMKCPRDRTRLKVNRAEGFKSGQWTPLDKAFAATNPVRAHRSLRKAKGYLNGR